MRLGGRDAGKEMGEQKQEVKQIRSKNKGDMIKREHKIKSKEVWLWGEKTSVKWQGRSHAA